MFSSQHHQLLHFTITALFFLITTTKAQNYCPLTFCGDTRFPIKFPFKLNNRPNSNNFRRCVYPGFSLTCDESNRTRVNLPFSGSFVVQNIDYMTQSLWIDDPDDCLPNRFLNGFDSGGSPFVPDHVESFTFLNCSNSVNDSLAYGYFRVVECLSCENYTVLAGPSGLLNESMLPSSCVKRSTVSIPVPWRLWSGIDVGVGLVWRDPSCGGCEEVGQACGFKKRFGLETGCVESPKLGLSRNTKYSIVLGIGIPALCCMIGLVCYLCSRVRSTSNRRRLIDAHLSNLSSIPPPPSIVLNGLDGPTIESYPKTLLGESKRLPRPNDNVCSICLCEYEAQDTLRTIPDCNHYFHVECIDGWLKMKATCPVCRNSPDSKSSVGSSSSSFVSGSGTGSTSFSSVPSTSYERGR